MNFKVNDQAAYLNLLMDWNRKLIEPFHFHRIASIT